MVMTLFVQAFTPRLLPMTAKPKCRERMLGSVDIHRKQIMKDAIATTPANEGWFRRNVWQRAEMLDFAGRSTRRGGAPCRDACGRGFGSVDLGWDYSACQDSEERPEFVAVVGFVSEHLLAAIPSTNASAWVLSWMAGREKQAQRIAEVFNDDTDFLVWRSGRNRRRRTEPLIAPIL
jgi:hypothetical protein